MNEFTQALTATLGSLGFLLFVFCFVVAIIGWPLLLVNAALNLRSIRKELQRLNNTLESKISVSEGRLPTL